MTPGALKISFNVLVTGGAGFIGSHLCDRLLADGHKVVCIDDLSLGRMENLNKASSNKSFCFLKQNILDRKALEDVFDRNRFDIVFHMAANSDIKLGGTETNRDLDMTFMTTFHVLDCMRIYDVKKLIFASTSAIYGEMPGLIHEDRGPLKPISFYGAGKLASEAYISVFVYNYGLQAWVFHFPNIVGPRATHGVIFDFVKKLNLNPNELVILGDGTQCKPYLYVEDLVDAILFGYESMKDTLNCVNIGVDSQTSVKTIAEIVVEEMDLPKVQFQYTGGNRGWKGDVPFFQYDSSKMKQLGWVAPRTSDDSVRLSVRRILGR